MTSKEDGLINPGNKWSRAISLGLLSSVIILSIGGYTTYLNYDIEMKNVQREMYQLISSVERNIEQSIINSHTAALTMALTINKDGVPINFDSVAAQVMSSNEYLDAVQLVPQGVIRYIYPMAGNEAAMNYDILNDSLHKKEALMAKELKQMYFAGPFELKQGGMAILGRMPIFIQGKFWGFSAVIIKLDHLLETSGISSKNNRDFHFQLSKINPNTGEVEYFLPRIQNQYFDFVEEINFPSGNWTLSVMPLKDQTKLTTVYIQGLFSLLLAIITGFFVADLVRRPVELQKTLRAHSLALIESERKFRSFFKQAAIGVAHVDTRTGRFLEVNVKYCKLVKYSEKELLEMCNQDIVYKDDLPETLKKREQLLSGEIREFSLEKRHVSKDGKIFWINLTVSPMWKPGEDPTSYIAFIEDITAKKNFQQLMLESSIQAQEKEKNRIAFELHDGIVQELVACGIQSESLPSTMQNHEELSNRIHQLTKLIKKVTNDTRNLSHNLLSADMNEMSLSELIGRLEHQLKSLSSIDFRMITYLENEDLIHKEVKINLYRAVQELTNNIIKHSKATKAVINIEQVSDEIYVTIRDNGIGLFDSNSKEMGIGTYNIRNRINKIGGKIEYSNLETGGLEVSFNVPIY